MRGKHFDPFTWTDTPVDHLRHVDKAIDDTDVSEATKDTMKAAIRSLYVEAPKTVTLGSGKNSLTINIVADPKMPDDELIVHSAGKSVRVKW